MATLRAAIATLLLGAAMACSDSDTPAAPQKLRVGIVPFAGWAALDVGIEKGFYKEFGVDLELVHYDGRDAELLTDTIEGRNVDIGMYTVGSFQGPAQEAGKRVRFLGETDWSYGADQLIGREPFEVDALRSRTKKIGVYSLTAATMFFVDRFLSDNDRHPGWRLGLDETDVVEEAPDRMVSSFGSFGLSLNYEPFSKDQLAAGGTLLATSESYPGVIPNGVAINEDVYAKIDKKTLVGFWTGWIKSVDWIFGRNNTTGAPDPANRAELYRILKSRTLVFQGDPKSTEAYTDQDLEAFLKNAPALKYKEFVQIHEDKRTDVKVLDYRVKGLQPLTSHIVELGDFVQNKRKGAPIDAARFYDGREILEAIASTK